jgi:hypothetical protein
MNVKTYAYALLNAFHSPSIIQIPLAIMSRTPIYFIIRTPSLRNALLSLALPSCTLTH